MEDDDDDPADGQDVDDKHRCFVNKMVCMMMKTEMTHMKMVTCEILKHPWKLRWRRPLGMQRA